jgi:hypothetical protein
MWKHKPTEGSDLPETGRTRIIILVLYIDDEDDEPSLLEIRRFGKAADES